MFSRGQFGHDAAVFRVQFDLGGDQAREDAAIANDGNAGFIARSFECKDGHSRMQRKHRTLNIELRTSSSIGCFDHFSYSATSLPVFSAIFWLPPERCA